MLSPTSSHGSPQTAKPRRLVSPLHFFPSSPLPPRFLTVGAWLLVLGASAGEAAEAAPPQPPPSRVFVIANSAFPGSRELGEYYIAQRGLPKENLVALDLPVEEDVTHQTFVSKIQNPLMAKFLEQKVFRGVLSTLANKQGVRLATLSTINADWLVLMRGVPLKIMHDATLMDKARMAEVPPQLQNTGASVDGELALIAGQEWNPLALSVNPWFDAESPVRDSSKHRLFLKVSRLDGPDDDSVRRLIDSAIDGERLGLAGRVYLDKGGPYKEGNDWIDRARTSLKPLGFELSFDERTGVLFGAQDRFDAPALYLGWYEGQLGGPFAFKDFRFPPGAIAIHLHSFSASTLRKADANWCAPLVARGVAGTVGNVYEPFLSYTHHFDILADRLARGWCWGDAAYAALPGLSWMDICIGDPLYQPFKKTLREQLEAPAVSANGRRAKAYATLRQANLLEGAGDSGGAQNTLLRFNATEFNLAVAARLAFPELAAGKPINARGHLRSAFAESFSPAPDEIGLCLEIAQAFRQAGDKPAALRFARLAVESPHVTDPLRIPLLPVAADIAEFAEDKDLAKGWRKQHEKLAPPAPRK